MTGETQLTVLLRTLAPERQPGDYVYATLPALQAELDPILLFRESEGWTHVLRREVADGPDAIGLGGASKGDDGVG